jgi:hypothetical protein
MRGFNRNHYLARLLRSDGLDGQKRESILRELRLRKLNQAILHWILGFLLLALVVTLFAESSGCVVTPPPRSPYTAPTSHSTSDKSATQPTDDSVKPKSNNKALSVLWAIAICSAGALVGFIFAVPRSQPPSGTPGSKSEHDKRPLLVANTNLEQISDWLTKIIVGVGLVEAKTLAGHLRAFAQIMVGTHCGISCESLAFAILITFSTAGFLIGYLVTRMILAPAFNLADEATGYGNTSQLEARRNLDATTGDGAGVNAKAVQQARAVINSGYVPTKDDPFKDRRDYAKSLLIIGEYAKAALAYDDLINEQPTDLLLQLDRLWALFEKNSYRWVKESSDAVEKLYNARKTADNTVAPDLFLNLTYYYLFAGTETELNRVVELVREYEAPGLPRLAGMYVNLACAYGQLYKLHKQLPPQKQKLGEEEKGAAEAIKTAIQLEPAVKDRIQQLFSPSADDNDLAVFRELPESRLVSEAAGFGYLPVRKSRSKPKGISNQKRKP